MQDEKEQKEPFTTGKNRPQRGYAIHNHTSENNKWDQTRKAIFQAL
jgi:hypothetical protein